MVYSIDAPDVVISSTASGFGRALAVVGDLDGDGCGEIAIGAPLATVNSGVFTGSLYLVRGGQGTRIIDVDAAVGDLLARMDGAATFSKFGASILALGDLDGDAMPDFAVGSPMADGAHMQGGKIHLFLGKDLDSNATLADAIEYQGVSASQGFGTSMAVADGGMLLIGAPGTESDKGRFYSVDPLSGIAEN